MRDVILSIRADESIHRDLNHRFAEILMHPFSEDKKAIDLESEIDKILDKDYRIKIGSQRTSITQDI